MTLHVEGLRWHDPDHANARCPAPSRSECYGVVAPDPRFARVPRSWGRGIRGTRALARQAAHCTPSTAFTRGSSSRRPYGSGEGTRTVMLPKTGSPWLVLEKT